MVDLKNILEIVDEIIVMPVVIITFFLLMYIAAYLSKKDPDIIRARIFLKYNEFKKSFLLLAAFAFLLVVHVSLIYIPLFLNMEEDPLIEDVQRFFGVALALILSAFVYLILKSIK